MAECPICKRQTCRHFAFGEDIRSYIGAEFVLWAFGMHIETNPPPHARPFPDIEKDIVKILGRHFVLADGKGYSKSPDRAVRHAKSDVAKYLRTLGYTIPEH